MYSGEFSRNKDPHGQRHLVKEIGLRPGMSPCPFTAPSAPSPLPVPSRGHKVPTVNSNDPLLLFCNTPLHTRRFLHFCINTLWVLNATMPGNKCRPEKIFVGKIWWKGIFWLKGHVFWNWRQSSNVLWQSFIPPPAKDLGFIHFKGFGLSLVWKTACKSSSSMSSAAPGGIWVKWLTVKVGKIWKSCRTCKACKEKSCWARYGNPARPARRNPTREDMGILQGLQGEILLGKIWKSSKACKKKSC